MIADEINEAMSMSYQCNLRIRRIKFKCPNTVQRLCYELNRDYTPNFIHSYCGVLLEQARSV